MVDDVTLMARVEERLQEDPRTAGSPIEVSAVAGEVTLSGVVRSAQAKEAAQAIAHSVPGVTLAIDELRVVDKTDDDVGPLAVTEARPPSEGGEVAVLIPVVPRGDAAGEALTGTAAPLGTVVEPEA